MGRVCVLGAGSWGTALAHHLAERGHDVSLWGRSSDVLDAIRDRHRNPHYLQGEDLSPNIGVSYELADAVRDRDFVLFSVPSSAVHALATQVAPEIAEGTTLVNTAKGFDASQPIFLSETLRNCIQKNVRVSVLSGPSFAREVVRGFPTAVTIAADSTDVAREVALLFHSPSFRVYLSDDLIGVEFGGIFKNVISIAAGVVDGLGMGTNSRAALITRGLFEMQGLVKALGGNPLTVQGLSGLGDLLLTATGDLSRNRRFGLLLAEGKSVDAALEVIGESVEGVASAPRVQEIANRLSVEAPITQEVANLVSGKESVHDSVERLLSREMKPEF